MRSPWEPRRAASAKLRKSRAWSRVFHVSEFCSLASFARARDGSGRGAVGDIGPKPRDGDRHAVAKAQQKQNVNQTPEPPSKRAMQPDETKVGNADLRPMVARLPICRYANAYCE
jgi:hypothetical protein